MKELITHRKAMATKRRSRYTSLRWMAILLVSFFILHRSSIPARAQGNVGIGTTSPNASALLDLTSTSRGLLVPRMMQAQMNAIAAPATGLLVYCTDSTNSSNPSTFYYYNGTAWVPFLGAGWLLLGNSGTNPTNNFIGTRDSVDWVIRTNNLEHVRVYAAGNVGLTNTNNTAEELRFFEPSGSGGLYTGFKAGINTVSVTYTLPPADGNGTNYVLCTDGFGNLSWKGFGSAGGGGVDTLWSRGAGAFSLVGHGSGNTAAGAYAITDGLDNTASGGGSVCWGEYNISSGYASTVAGGYSDTASGNYSTIGGGENNSATGSFASVCAGQNNSACGSYAVVVGGSNNTACGNYATVLGGDNNSVSGNYSLAFGVGATVTQNNTIVYYNTSGCSVGIGNVSPSEALDVTGNLKFSGALKPNNLAGTSGYVLASTGGASAPVWVAPSNLYWTILGNTGTSPSTNYLGTTDAQDLVFRTNNTERMRILAGGNVGIGVTTTSHQLHVLYTGTTNETAAVYGNATGATTNQAIGVWGAATNTSTANTGTIGVLATGNGNTSAGTTNVALQLNDGEFTMGRTTQAPSVGSDVEAAAAGTSYSQQGPSGVVELTLGGGNLTTVAPTSGVFQNLGVVTIDNQFCTTSSIVLVNIVSKLDDGVAPDCRSAEYFADVTNRTAGTFDIRIGMIPTITNGTNYSTSDKIRIGYMIVNPGR